MRGSQIGSVGARAEVRARRKVKEVTVTDLRREERVGLRRDAVPQHQQMPMAAFRIQGAGATWPVARAESGQDKLSILPLEQSTRQTN